MSGATIENQANPEGGTVQEAVNTTAGGTEVSILLQGLRRAVGPNGGPPTVPGVAGEDSVLDESSGYGSTILRDAENYGTRSAFAQGFNDWAANFASSLSPDGAAVFIRSLGYLGNAVRVGGEFAGPASAVVAAGILLYPVAKGSPDEQVSTLQPGTPWNPDGTPTAPSILPTHGAVQVLAVANQAQLAAAIETVNASPGNYAIHVTADISLNADLPALNQPLGVVRIDGEGHVLDGADTYRGLMVDDTQALLKDLTIQDAVAQGGAGGIGKAGGGGGGGAGLGGGVLAVNHATIALDDVSFTNDAATGGQGGAREAGALLGSAGYGGGGGMGGAGGAGSAWHSSVGGVFGDIGQHLNPLVQADEDDGRDGSSGGGGGLGIAATGSASGPGGRSSILTGADGGLGLDDGTSANNDAAGVGGGLGANGV